MGKRGNGEGSIYKQRDGLWAACVTVEGNKRKYFYGKTRKEVQEKLAKALHEQQQGTLVETSKQSVEQYLTSWLENTQRHSVRPRTYERYEEVVRLHIVPVLGKHQLQKLTVQHVQAFYAKKLDDGLSATTVGHFHNVLHKALENAVRWNLIPRNICDLASPPRRKRFEPHQLTLEQIKRLLAATEGHEMEALFKLALATGMRRGEIMGLKWQDIDFDAGVLQVKRVLSRVPSKLPGIGYVEAEPKTETSRRSIVVASFALEALKEHRVHQLEAKLKVGPAWQDHDYVFCTSIGTHLNPTRDILDQLKLLLKKADLPDIRFHDLRHCVATLLMGMGVPARVVQEILGHSNVTITLGVYSHVQPTMQREAVERLNRMLEG